MNKSKIKQFRLFKQNLPTHEPDPRYWYNTINTDNFSQFLNHINSSINFHHQDLNWDNTPTLEVVYDRLAFGSQCHLWMYEEKCLGWHWTNPNSELSLANSLQLQTRNYWINRCNFNPISGKYL